MSKRITEAEAIEKIKSLIRYKNTNLDTELEFLGFLNGKWNGGNTYLILKCNKHNITWTTTSFGNFCKINSVCCSECAKKNRAKRQVLNPEEALNRIVEIHKNDDFKYDYSKIKDTYINYKNRVTITCPIHGDYEVKYTTLLNPNKGKCPKCNSEQLIIRNSLSRSEALNKIK